MKVENDIPYPHIEGAGVVLPDCSKGIYRPFRLTSGEKRDLIKGLAEKGLQGLDEFLASPRDSGAVADRLEELRQRISKQLEQVRAKRREALDDEIRRLTRSGAMVWRTEEDGLLEDPSAFRRYSSEQIRGEILASELISVLEGKEEPRQQVEKAGWIERIWKLIKGFFSWIAEKLLSFFGWIRRLFRGGSGKRGKDGSTDGKRSKGAISLPFPGLENDLVEWERRMDRKLEEDPHLQNAVNKRLSERYGYDAGRIRLKKAYDPDWYREEARKVLEDEVSRTAERKSKELDEERSSRTRKREEAIERERKVKDQIMKLEKEMDREEEAGERKIEEMTASEMKKELLQTLSFMGYLERSESHRTLEEASYQWEVTEALVEKFSEFILAEILQSRSSVMDRRGRQISDAGVYEKARMRTFNEEARMDMLQTLVNARLNHPRDKDIDPFDIIVHREVTTSELHAVLLVDVSGSMEENMRLEAAKRSVLALSQAIKRENPRNKVDIISVSTRARPVTLKEVMSLEPRGFTNHQEAFAIARSLFDGSRSDRHLLFLITDGLPEAYMDSSGNPVAGDLKMAMDLTLAEVSALERVHDLAFEVFLLEPEDETFVSAARKMAKAGNGNVIIADPQELAYRVIGEYISGDRVLEGV
ncbi:MAG: VWA domain-containing protein [Thermoplasmatota archaeon]